MNKSIPITKTRGFTTHLFGNDENNHPSSPGFKEQMEEYENLVGGRLFTLPIVTDGGVAHLPKDLYKRGCMGFALPFIGGPIGVMRQWDDVATGQTVWTILSSEKLAAFYAKLTFAHERTHMSVQDILFNVLSVRVDYGGRDRNLFGRYGSVNTFGGGVFADTLRVYSHEVLHHRTDDRRGACMLVVIFDPNDVTRVHTVQ